MEILIKLLQFILSFSLLVLVHEFGHFIAARIFKIRVEKFYLFFNPWFSIFKFRIKDTEFGMGWVPFGGYCKISGMIDESMDTEQMKQEPQPYEFRSKPAWQRLFVMIGGVVMNVVLAICIYIGMSYAWGKTFVDNNDFVYGYAFSDTAKKIGFRDGDKILLINGKQVSNYEDIPMNIMLEQSSIVTVQRGDQVVEVEVDDSSIAQLIKSKGVFLEPRIPFSVEDAIEGGNAKKAGFVKGDRPVAINGDTLQYYDQFKRVFTKNIGKDIEMTVARDSAGVVLAKNLVVRVSDEGTIGVAIKPIESLLKISKIDYSLAQAIPAGFSRAGDQLSSYWKQIKLMFRPKTEAYKSLGGVITIGSIFPSHWSWEGFWTITAFLSIVLAVMNILPIPALDGGHVLFLLVEVVTRRKPSDKFLERAQLIGLIIVFGLILFATGNDIYRFFIK